MGADGQAGGCLFSYQPAAAEKEPGRAKPGEQRNESRLVEPELAHSGLQNHTTVRAMLCRLKCQGGISPFIKFSFSNLIAASNKQFFQISSDLRSSEYGS